MKNNIVLLGMMGCGKSTIGGLLAQKYSNYNFVDVDFLIEFTQHLSISEIFQKYGEEYFRDIEKEIIKSIFDDSNQIISIGGGAFENNEIRDLILKNSLTIYLKCDIKQLYDRIKDDKKRPLLADFSSFNQIFQKRERNYELSEIIIDTTDKTVYNIVDEILKKVKGHD